jgi:hypothetical protein
MIVQSGFAYIRALRTSFSDHELNPISYVTIVVTVVLAFMWATRRLR